MKTMRKVRIILCISLVCILLLSAGCEYFEPSLETEEAKLINEYFSLIGMDKQSVYAKLSVSEDLLQEDKQRNKIMPKAVSAFGRDFEVLLAFNPATDILNGVEIKKSYPLNEENLSDASLFLSEIAQYLTEKYGASCTERYLRDDKGRIDYTKPFSYVNTTPENIVEYIKGDPEAFDWIVTENMPQSVQDYAHSAIGQQFGSIKALNVDILAKLSVICNEKITLRVSYAAKATEFE